jgi:hypothetical protein
MTMKHTPSTYYKSLCTASKLHFISALVAPSLGEYLPYPTVVEVVDVYMRHHRIHYLARVWFDDRVTSNWYEVEFHPSFGSMFDITGCYQNILLSSPSLAQVDFIGYGFSDVPF